MGCTCEREWAGVLSEGRVGGAEVCLPAGSYGQQPRGQPGCVGAWQRSGLDANTAARRCCQPSGRYGCRLHTRPFNHIPPSVPINSSPAAAATAPQRRQPHQGGGVGFCGARLACGAGGAGSCAGCVRSSVVSHFTLVSQPLIAIQLGHALRAWCTPAPPRLPRSAPFAHSSCLVSPPPALPRSRCRRVHCPRAAAAEGDGDGGRVARKDGARRGGAAGEAGGQGGGARGAEEGGAGGVWGWGAVTARRDVQ